ncbi:MULTISPECIES: hypothetical protein [unclassified Bacillus (in: firmicutes)]|uniref:hypothetical protein n=1 Tax=unclassified Bacillus (in: firmicutes) TaxID=185979 RepID=UPI0008F3AC2D|nr:MULTISPECIES: hypothetical protein [unclassified Bacillus (in: firmicutes)]SFA72679.1 hypothetical protein SAMN02799634_101312 [Bacillus sp. UNCCL13]SFQ62818.1 hypothetical protein SAMN04488577_0591 [Bacillus sp. cl95]
MWAIIGLVFISIMICAIELPTLWKQKLRKEMVIFFVLLGMGFTLSTLLALNIKVPPILDAVEFVFKPVSDLVFSFLQ